MRGLAVVAALALAAFACGACASKLATSAKVITSAAQLTQQAGELLVHVDAMKQDAIAAEAEKTGDAAAAKAKLSAWRAERAKARGAIKAVAAAVVSASATVTLVQAGAEQQLSLDKIVGELMRAVGMLRETLAAFGVDLKLPGGL